MEKPQAHVQQWKKDLVSQISTELPKYTTVAIINLENLPSRESQIIRSKIKNDIKLIPINIGIIHKILFIRYEIIIAPKFHFYEGVLE